MCADLLPLTCTVTGPNGCYNAMVATVLLWVIFTLTAVSFFMDAQVRAGQRGYSGIPELVVHVVGRRFADGGPHEVVAASGSHAAAALGQLRVGVGF